MAFKIAPLAVSLAAAPGTGSFELTGAAQARMALETVIGDGVETWYWASDGDRVEWGRGTVSAGSPPTVSRAVVYGTTEGGTEKLNFTVPVTVWVAVPSRGQVVLDPDLEGPAFVTALGRDLVEAADAAAARARLGVGRNALVDGGFDFWMEGAGQAVNASIAPYGSLTMYRFGRGGTGSNSFSRSTNAPPGARYSAQVTVAAGTSLVQVVGFIEADDARELLGEATFSFGAFRGVNTGYSVILDKPAERNDFSATSSIASASGNLPATGAWVRQAETFALSVADIENGLRVRCQLTGTTEAELCRFGALCMASGRRAEFAGGPIAGALARVSRYYQKSYDLDVAPGTVTTAGRVRAFVADGANTLSGGANVRLQAAMRAVPAITLYSHATGAAGKIRNAATEADIDALLSALNRQAFHVRPSSTGDINTGDSLSFHFVADARL